ncbi:DUF3574 domain-containing protein [Edaphovirga cremea]|uniref:DUF3574 domain-containing protein n=1 Tax=Edaphovirga cremea TaxID=2267246 RepID=UPI000DEFBF8A|nr:DUF3574 domain-containing protein [Edaphovirga cremea]
MKNALHFLRGGLPGTLVLVGSLMLAGCVVPAKQTVSVEKPAPIIECAKGDVMTQTTLYFGLSRPSGSNISQREWSGFVDAEVTPLFQDGLSVFDAKGQWMGKNGKIARESSKALMIIHAPGQASDESIESVRTRYKQVFDQEAVMRVDVPVCVSF